MLSYWYFMLIKLKVLCWRTICYTISIGALSWSVTKITKFPIIGFAEAISLGKSTLTATRFCELRVRAATSMTLVTSSSRRVWMFFWHTKSIIYAPRVVESGKEGCKSCGLMWANTKIPIAAFKIHCNMASEMRWTGMGLQYPFI